VSERTPVPPRITAAHLAAAFDGTAEPVQTSFLYRLYVLLVFLCMIVLPLAYVAIIAAAIVGMYWYAVYATVMRAFSFMFVLYAAPFIAGGLLVLFMVLPLFWKSRKIERPMWVDRNEQPLLYAYIDRLCDAMGAPRPARIDVMPNANASAHIDNGLLGLFSRRLVLTIGLPLTQAMDLRQFTGVLAHELGHFAQGGSMRLSYVIARINIGFLFLAYGRSGIDELVEALIGNEPNVSRALAGFLCKIVLSLARLVIKALALLSHALSMRLSRQAEFDADRQAARIVGADAMGEALQALPFLAAAGDLALKSVRSAWKRRALPDDLVVMVDAFHRDMPAALKETITARVLERDANWFDTHPPLFKRVAALKKAGAPGILKLNAPATILFKDFDELCKMATIGLYRIILGDALQPEFLVPSALPATAGTGGTRRAT
jgi:Zn-dependent protease with chaperone function